jgi:hypothetical protein
MKKNPENKPEEMKKNTEPRSHKVCDRISYTLS